MIPETNILSLEPSEKFAHMDITIKTYSQRLLCIFVYITLPFKRMPYLPVTQQGRILDGTVAYRVHDLTFRIYDAETSGTLFGKKQLQKR